MASCSRKAAGLRCQLKELIRIRAPPTCRDIIVVVSVVLSHLVLQAISIIAVTPFQRRPFMRKVATVPQDTFQAAQMETIQQVETRSTKDIRNRRTLTSTRHSCRQWPRWEIGPDLVVVARASLAMVVVKREAAIANAIRAQERVSIHIDPATYPYLLCPQSLRNVTSEFPLRHQTIRARPGVSVDIRKN